ncbi:hypothetical protein EDB85DRAFT_2014132, partial [Lactarius pseudohatsudake]
IFFKVFLFIFGLCPPITALLLVDEYTKSLMSSLPPPSCHHPPLHEILYPTFCPVLGRGPRLIPYHLALSLTPSFLSPLAVEPCLYIFWGRR